MSNAESQPALSLDATKIAALLDEHGGDPPDALEAAIVSFMIIALGIPCMVRKTGITLTQEQFEWLEDRRTERDVRSGEKIHRSEIARETIELGREFWDGIEESEAISVHPDDDETRREVARAAVEWYETVVSWKGVK